MPRTRKSMIGKRPLEGIPEELVRKRQKPCVTTHARAKYNDREKDQQREHASQGIRIVAFDRSDCKFVDCALRKAAASGKAATVTVPNPCQKTCESLAAAGAKTFHGMFSDYLRSLDIATGRMVDTWYVDYCGTFIGSPRNGFPSRDMIKLLPFLGDNVRIVMTVSLAHRKSDWEKNLLKKMHWIAKSQCYHQLTQAILATVFAKHGWSYTFVRSVVYGKSPGSSSGINDMSNYVIDLHKTDNIVDDHQQLNDIMKTLKQDGKVKKNAQVCLDCARVKCGCH